MKIYSVMDPEFKRYGQVLESYDTTELVEAMKAIPMPESGTAYEPGIASLEACGIFGEMQDNVYGGMPVQLGMCWGYNTKMNCLEYHRDSEINVGTGDYVLLLAMRDEIEDWKLDTSKVMAFRAPAGVAVEVYATALHYAPCHVNPDEGFRVAVVLPKDTNTDKPAIVERNTEDKLLRARNKWLLAHPESSEAADGAWVGLVGENVDIAGSI